jgi:S1-C subfamily serine protease
LLFASICIALLSIIELQFEKHRLPALSQSLNDVVSRVKRAFASREDHPSEWPGTQVTAKPPIGVDFSPERTKSETKQAHHNLTPAEVARMAFPSVVLLTMQDERGQTRSLGSGFFVEKNIVATNYHVINQSGGGQAKIIGQTAHLNIKGVVAVDTSHDLALLQLDDSSANPLELAPSISINIGDSVYAIGNPYGLEGTFSQGVVSSIREVRTDRLLQITAAISPGSSGGPVLDETGTVIGVSFLTLVGGQNLNFAIPSQYVISLIRNKSEPRPLATVSQSAPAALFGRVGGQEARSGVVGENLTYDRPVYQTGDYSFSIRNKLKQSVANISGVLVFYDTHGEPIDIQSVRYAGVIPAGLAKRMTGHVDASVERLNCPDRNFPYLSAPPRPPKAKVEFRVFDFSMGDSAEVSAKAPQPR